MRFWLIRGVGRLFLLPVVVVILAIATLPTPRLSGLLLPERQLFLLRTITLVEVVARTQPLPGRLGQCC